MNFSYILFYRRELNAVMSDCFIRFKQFFVQKLKRLNRRPIYLKMFIILNNIGNNYSDNK